MANAAECTPVNDRPRPWVRLAILMCDNTLSVEYVNGFCCNYPGTTAAMYRALVNAPIPGQWARQNLYRRPYRQIRLPCPPAGCVSVDCCPGIFLRNKLHATFTGGNTLTGTYELDWNGTSLSWTGNIPCAPPGSTTLELACVMASWQLRNNFLDLGALTESCSPFALTFNGDFSGCTGDPLDNNLTVTVTL